MVEGVQLGPVLVGTFFMAQRTFCAALSTSILVSF